MGPMELVTVVKRQGLKAPEEAFQVHTLQDKNDAFSTSDPQFPTSRPCTNKKEEVQSACEYIIMRQKKKSISEVTGQRRPGRGFEKSYSRGADILTSNTTHRMQPYRNFTDSVQTRVQRLSKENTMLPLPAASPPKKSSQDLFHS